MFAIQLPSFLRYVLERSLGVCATFQSSQLPTHAYKVVPCDGLGGKCLSLVHQRLYVWSGALYPSRPRLQLSQTYTGLDTVMLYNHLAASSADPSPPDVVKSRLSALSVHDGTEPLTVPGTERG